MLNKWSILYFVLGLAVSFTSALLSDINDTKKSLLDRRLAHYCPFTKEFIVHSDLSTIALNDAAINTIVEKIIKEGE